MTRSKGFLLAWLTLQWLISGPLVALLGTAMFFSDTHGLPNENAWVVLLYLLIVTAGYIVALRSTKFSENRA